MATHVLSLERGSESSIPLSATDCMVLDYSPQSADIRATGHGQEIYELERQLVTETLRLHIYAATGALVQAKITEIERFITDVIRRQQVRGGDRCYIYSNLSSDSEDWRSEILNARLVLGDQVLHEWGSATAEVLLVITRRPYWETVAEVELELDNGSAGAAATGGVTIYNHDDANTGHDNWVDIAAAQVTGNVPSPVRLTLTNSSGVSLSTVNFYQAVNAHYSPTTFTHVIEGESAVYASVQADANSSSGNFGRATWTTQVAHTTNLFQWTIDAAYLAKSQGGFFRVLARFANTVPTNIELQLHVKIPATSPITTLWAGPKITAGTGYLQDLGVVQLPPGIPSGSHYDISLVLSAAFTGTDQLDIDFLQLTPAESTRWFRQAGYSIPDGDWIVNDGQTGRIYEVDAATGKQSNIYESYNGTLYLWPNRDQRIIMIHDETPSMNVLRTWTVQAYYRPRRNSI